ncbi:DUF5682 family protein [Propionibacteriaceae bacterium G1746]|uniref:DUF5682 family protein n=1 Tax=Aestuariimicrobium sp. G57 TaxID=3418485 RepID=UPI003C258AA0
MTEADEHTARVEFFGVRHHSPAAARLVAQRVAADPPAAVLIEGPSEFNDQLDQLVLPHELPVMIYAWAPRQPNAEPGTPEWGERRAGYYPLCDYSPEWQAFVAADRAGVPVRFIDLPWLGVVDLAQSENRFAEPQPDPSDHKAFERLTRALGVETIDVVFDELFEIDPDLGLPTLTQRMQLVGSLLRRTPEDDETQQRESFMAARIAEALAEAPTGTVLVVCGAAHIDGLRAALAHPGPAVEVHRPAPGDERYGIALTPTSYAALDALDGYNAGQPTPGFYDAVWRDRLAGRTDTVERLLQVVAADLRAAGQFVSPADLIAVLATARGLAQLRGHVVLWRTDLLDALSSALVKDDAGDDHPLLHRVRLVLRGDRLGRLAPGTKQPPLVTEITTALRAHGLVPDPTPRREQADLTDRAGLSRSRLLHSLAVLEVPVADLLAGAESDGVETWRLAWSPEYEGSLVVASRFGATVEAAVTARLLDEARTADDDPRATAAVLLKAALCGVESLSAAFQARTARVLATSGDLAGVGAALDLLMRLYRYDPLLRTTGRTDLGTLVQVAFGRCCRLLERLGHTADGPATEGIVTAIKVATDTLERTATVLDLDADDWDSALATVLDDTDQAAELRGAALGGRWLTSAIDDGALADGLARVSTPDQLGDFVAGLLTVARESALRRPTLVQRLDDIVTALGDDEFLSAVPGLRRAFSRYPPRDRDRVARVLLGELAAEALAPFVGTTAEAVEVAAFEADLAATISALLGEGVL